MRSSGLCNSVARECTSSSYPHECERPAMKTNWPEATKELTTLLGTLRVDTPEVMQAFSGIARSALVSGTLDSKTKELIALGIAVAIRCDDCIAFHARAACGQGGTAVECTPSGGHGSGREIDHPPGVLLFELGRAPVSKRGMEPLAVVDLIDEARQ